MTKKEKIEFEKGAKNLRKEWHKERRKSQEHRKTIIKNCLKLAPLFKIEES